MRVLHSETRIPFSQLPLPLPSFNPYAPHASPCLALPVVDTRSRVVVLDEVRVVSLGLAWLLG